MLRALSGIGLVFCGVAARAGEDPKARVISITAERYRFTPNRLELVLGQPVILEFTTEDVPMGFNAPSLKLRTNILPDMPARLYLIPTRRGVHHFHCDVACGSGHGAMKGVIIVV